MHKSLFMKKYLFLVASLTFSFLVKAQNVSINADGSAPDASAILDVKSITKGILAPRMTASERGAILSPATGLLVYQTDGSTGFYTNTGTPLIPVWVMLSTSTSGWQVTGNAGTNPAINFIGTTDNIPFNVRVNNQEAGGIDSTLQNTFWGYQAGLNTTGVQNTAKGFQALILNTTGMQNTATGMGSLQANTIGNFNTANGSYSLQSNTTGEQNTANGVTSLY